MAMVTFEEKVVHLMTEKEAERMQKELQHLLLRYVWCLNENVPHRFVDLNTWSSSGRLSNL